MHDVIIAEKLRVVRSKQTILDDLQFSIASGKITGLIGPSGSGKTTLMRSVVGAQKISSGSLTVLGKPAGRKALRSQIGYVTQSPAIYDDLTVYQNLAYFSAVLGCKKTDVERVIGQVDLRPYTKQLTRTLSGGQRARVSLAIALLNNAKLLILDEPTVGLDPLLRRDLWHLFADLAAQGATLLISSHVMDEAEQCQDLLLLRDGKVLSYSSKGDLLAKTASQTVQAAFVKLIEKTEVTHAS